MEHIVIDTYRIGNRYYSKMECVKHSLCYTQRKETIGVKTGCVLCAKEKQIKGQTKGISYFIERSKIIHGDRYSYDSVVYINSKTKVKIKCNCCETYFMQRPDQHKSGNGCPNCAGNSPKTTLEFIKEASLLHDNYYDYSKFVYVSNATKGVITCPKHGDFNMKPNSHLASKNGCKHCANELGGFDYNAFKTKCDKNNNGFGFLYVIYCYDDNESFYKIGITSTTINRRFHTKKSMPYKYEIIQCIEYDSKIVYKLEKLLHYQLKCIAYTPSIKFEGYTECFKPKLDQI